MLRNNGVNFLKQSKRKMSQNFLHLNNLANIMNDVVTCSKFFSDLRKVSRNETNPRRNKIVNLLGDIFRNLIYNFQ